MIVGCHAESSLSLEQHVLLYWKGKGFMGKVARKVANRKHIENLLNSVSKQVCRCAAVSEDVDVGCTQGPVCLIIIVLPAFRAFRARSAVRKSCQDVTHPSAYS